MMQAIHLHHHASLLEGARQFIAEVLRLRQEVDAPPRTGPDGRLVPAKRGAEIRRHLRDLLNLQALRRTRRAGEEDPQSEKARYALAAFADEIFLHQPWQGQEDWHKQLLEAEVFHSARAGEQVFKDIQELLEHESAAQAQLGAVYLLVLSLGFQGKYRKSGRQAELEEWRIRLASFLSSLMEEGLDVERPRRLLFPQAYELSAGLADGALSQERRLTSLRPWLLLLGLGLVVYLVVGHLIWHVTTGPLRAELELIEKAAK